MAVIAGPIQLGRFRSALNFHSLTDFSLFVYLFVDIVVFLFLRKHMDWGLDMKKKLSLVILFIAFTVLSVSAHSIYVQASPFSHQHIYFNEARIEHGSEYGWGAKVAYRFGFSEVGSVGADISFSDFKYDGSSEHYLVLSALAKIACNVGLSEKIGLDLDFGVGADVRWFADSQPKATPTFGIYMGLCYALNRNLEIAAGGDFRVSYQKSVDSYYDSSDVLALINAGVKVNL